jgi:hypothetical protein
MKKYRVDESKLELVTKLINTGRDIPLSTSFVKAALYPQTDEIEGHQHRNDLLEAPDLAAYLSKRGI